MKARASSLFLSVLIVIAFPGALEGAQAKLSTIEMQAAIEDRTAFGLPADPETIASIVSNHADAGSDTWGMVLTSDEFEALDLDGRLAFENAATELILRAQASPTFAGAYFDQSNGDQLVLRFTALTESEADAIHALTPSPSRGVVLGDAKFTHTELEAALAKGVAGWKDLFPAVELVTMGIDERANGLKIGVKPDDFGTVANQSAAIEAQFGVGVEVTAASPSPAATCTSRSNCYSPMKAGILIKAGTYLCTMGFHVTAGSNRKMLTAGHCSGPPGGGLETWFHTTNVIVGGEQVNLFKENGSDIELVDINFDIQASHMIYGTSRQVHAAGYPVTGELICASLRVSNTYDCGTVNDNSLTYTIGPIGGVTYHNYGWDANGLAIQTGDSGGPMFKPDSLGAEAIALGLISTLGGSSPIIPGNLANFGVSINW